MEGTAGERNHTELQNTGMGLGAAGKKGPKNISREKAKRACPWKKGGGGEGREEEKVMGKKNVLVMREEEKKNSKKKAWGGEEL